MFKWNVLSSNLCPLPLILSVDTTKTLACLHLPIRYLCTLSLSLFFYRLSSPKSLNLSLYDRYSSTLIVLAALHWTHSSMFTSFRDQVL